MKNYLRLFAGLFSLAIWPGPIFASNQAKSDRPFLVSVHHATLRWQETRTGYVKDLCSKGNGHLEGDPIFATGLTAGLCLSVQQPQGRYAIVHGKYAIKWFNSSTNSNRAQLKDDLKASCDGELYGPWLDENINGEFHFLARICVQD